MFTAHLWPLKPLRLPVGNTYPEHFDLWNKFHDFTGSRDSPRERLPKYILYLYVTQMCHKVTFF